MPREWDDMTVAVDLELAAARHHWLANADYWRYGACGVCRRSRDDDDRPLLVARRGRERRFRCFDCESRRPRRRAA
jgi:hypothetical protein